MHAREFGYNNTMKYSVRMVVSEGAAEVSSRQEWGSFVKAAMKIAEEKKLTGNDYMILDGPNKLKIVVVGKPGQCLTVIYDAARERAKF